MKSNILPLSAQHSSSVAQLRSRGADLRRVDQNQTKHMKLKLSVLIPILSGLAYCLASVAQNNAPAGNTPEKDAAPAPAATDSTPPVVAQADVPPTNAPPAVPPANPPPAEAPAVVPAPVVPAPGTQPEPTPPPTVVEPPTTFVTPNAPAVPGAIIPLIVMDDVPLTDAIKNLARQA